MSNRQPIRYGGRNLPRELTQLLLVCVGGVYWLLFGAQHQFLVGPGFILLAFVLSRRWRLTALAILVVLRLVACIWPVWLSIRFFTDSLLLQNRLNGGFGRLLVLPPYCMMLGTGH